MKTPARGLALAALLAAACADPPAGRPDASPDGAPGADAAPLPPLAGGFTDLTESLGPLPFGLHPGDGMSAEPESTVGLFYDLDGDGADELLLTPTRSAAAPLANRRAHVWRLDRASGAWRPAGPVPGDGELVVMAVADLDDDGRPDLLLGQDRFPSAVLVAWGRDGGFDPPTALSDQATLGNFGSGALLLDDVDGDGWTDLVVGNRYCTPGSRLAAAFLRVGARDFRPDTAAFPPSPGASVYALLSLRPDPSTHYVVAMGQGCGAPPPTFFLRGPASAEGAPRFAVADPVPERPYFNDFQHAPRVISEYAPMGGAIADFGDDGVPDLFIALDPFRTFFETVPGARFRDLSEASGMALGMTPRGTKTIPWTAAFVDLNRDMRPDLVLTHGNDNTAWYQPMQSLGPQRTTAHVNAGGARFREVTLAVGLGREGQWRALAVGDPDRDGDADLLVGGQGERPRLYRNDLRATGHAISFRLAGTTGGRYPTGARVTVRAGGRAMRAWAGDTAGAYALGEPVLFLATGDAPRAESVAVDWPSGFRQELRDVPADARHDLTEPRVLEVSPAGRHAPADGASVITLRVTPRAPDGAEREAVVGVRVVAGACTPGEPVRTGLRWEVPLRAPAAPGTCSVEVSVDGQALRVRPRLWWD